jgi:hypothetical protein
LFLSELWWNYHIVFSIAILKRCVVTANFLKVSWHFLILKCYLLKQVISSRGCRDQYCMVVGFTTTYAISVYHQYCCKFESHSWWGVLDTTLCDKVYQWLMAGRWFSTTLKFLPPIKFTDRYNITEILLKVALNTITLIL